MIIYKITNLVNGKIYVGQTIHTLAQRWSGHICDSKRTNRNRTPLCNAIAKYGPERFKMEELGRYDTIEELNKQEEQWISVWDSTNRKVGYNVKFGGGNHHQRAEVRKPVVRVSIETLETKEYPSIKSTAQDGFKPKHIGLCCRKYTSSLHGFVWWLKSEYEQLTPEQIRERLDYVRDGWRLAGGHILRLKAYADKQRGVPLSLMHRQALAEARRNMSPEARGRGGRALLGRKHSEESRKKMSVAKLGKKHTSSTLKKMKKIDRAWLKKSVRCIETEQVFDSIKEAARGLGLSDKYVSDSLHGRGTLWRPTGYTFEFTK